MLHHWIDLTTPARWMPRVALVTVSLVPLTIVTLAFVPALAILPFLPSRHGTSERMVSQLVSWTRALLHGSRSR